MRYCKHAIITGGDYVPYGMGTVQTPDYAECDNPVVPEDEIDDLECDETCPYYEADDTEESDEVDINQINTYEDFADIVYPMWDNETLVAGNVNEIVREKLTEGGFVIPSQYEEWIKRNIIEWADDLSGIE
jgi:hypothetical protein